MSSNVAYDFYLDIAATTIPYLSNQGFLAGRPPSWETANLFLELVSITILILLLGILSGEGQTLIGQF